MNKHSAIVKRSVVFLVAGLAIWALVMMALAGSEVEGYSRRRSHGWPWVFTERSCRDGTSWLVQRYVPWWNGPIRVSPPGTPIMYDFDEVRSREKSFNALAFSGDLAVLGAGIMLVLVVSGRALRSPGMRFTMAHLAMAMTAVCAACGYVAWRQHRHAREVKVVWQLREREVYVGDNQYRGPRWLLQLVGHSRWFQDIFHHRSTALIDRREHAEETGRMLLEIPYLECLRIGSKEDFTDADFHALLQARNRWRLKELWIAEGNRITDDGLQELKRCPDLEDVGICEGDIGDAGAIVVLESCPKLTRLYLGSRVTDAALEHVHRARHLRDFSAHGSGITDTGLESLTACREIDDLHLKFAHLTPQCIESLRQFPKLRSLAVGPFSGSKWDEVALLKQQLQELNLERLDFEESRVLRAPP